MRLALTPKRGYRALECQPIAWVARILVATLAVGAGAPPAQAQSRPLLGVIDGVVTDTGLVSLADATVLVLGSGIKVVTNASGRFRFLGMPAGEYIVMVRHLGFAPVSAAVQVAERDTSRASFALERVSTMLDTVRVATKRVSFRLAEFEARRTQGEGQFMTQADIDKHNNLYAVELLRNFLAVDVRGTVNNRRYPSARGACPYQFFIDGIAIPTPRNPDMELPAPRELSGIELYASPATIPLQYRPLYSTAQCGVILLWTKGG